MTARKRPARMNAALAVWAVLLVFALWVMSGLLVAAYAQVPPDATRHQATLLREAQRQWGLQPPLAALAAQVHQESGWNPNAVSRVGARGMAQFMPATTRWWCERMGTPAEECLPHNPVWALRALVGYDLFLYQRAPAYHARFDRLWLALRGYNGGEGNWQAEARTTGVPQPTRLQIDAACGKARRAALHCAENLNYPRRILLTLQPRYASWGAVWEPVLSLSKGPAP
jgi:soluble lytic murein transglycosylase-like protein